MIKLPAPKNTTVKIINVVLDVLIKGLGKTAAISAAVAVAPWLAWPGISFIFGEFVSYLASALDTNLKQFADIVVIRFQNDYRRAVYDMDIEALKKSPDDAAALQAAKDAADRFINRNK